MPEATERVLPDELVTQRLTLRPFRFSDVPDMFAYVQEPDMGIYLEGADAPLTEKKVAAIIAQHILVDKTERCVWAITLMERVVGAISINLAKQQRIAEIGYSIMKPIWGQGYASEAAKAVIDAAFATYPNLQRIQANIHPENKGSVRVAERVGMAYEATLKNYSFVGGKVVDEDVYVVLRDS